MKDQESLQTSAVVGQLADAVQAQIDNFFTEGVVSTGEVICSILFAGDQLFRMEQLTVGSGTDLIDDGGLQIDEDGPGDVFASTSLGEEGVESIITTTDGLIGGHLTIRLDTVLQAVQLPAGVTDLDTGLTDVNAEGFTHFEFFLR